jgi:hypothetical protein
MPKNKKNYNVSLIIRYSDYFHSLNCIYNQNTRFQPGPFLLDFLHATHRYPQAMKFVLLIICITKEGSEPCVENYSLETDGHSSVQKMPYLLLNPKLSLSCPQQPEKKCPYTEPDESNPYLHTLFTYLPHSAEFFLRTYPALS